MTQQEIIEGNKLIAELKSFGYSVFSDGIVRGKKGQILKVAKGTSGYLQLNAQNGSLKKTFLIHRLVASAFIPNPGNLPQVNHKDGNKLNNHFTNLEWCTPSHNIKHGFDTGLIRKSMIGRTGNKHWRSLTVVMYNINGEMVEFESTGDAARKTGFSAKSIQDACKGRIKVYQNCKWRYKV